MSKQVEVEMAPTKHNSTQLSKMRGPMADSILIGESDDYDRDLRVFWSSDMKKCNCKTSVTLTQLLASSSE